MRNIETNGSAGTKWMNVNFEKNLFIFLCPDLRFCFAHDFVGNGGDIT